MNTLPRLNDEELPALPESTPCPFAGCAARGPYTEAQMQAAMRAAAEAQRAADEQWMRGQKTVAWRVSGRQTYSTSWTDGEPSQQTIDYWKAEGVELEYAFASPVPASQDEKRAVRGHLGSTPDGGIDDHDEGGLSDSLTRAVDQWFAANTGLGGCSDRDARDLADLFYGVTFGGGRESVDDAMAVVESFGPGIQGLNDTFARQVILASEVKRLRDLYAVAVVGRQQMREALRTARDHISMDSLKVSHCKDAAEIEAALRQDENKEQQA